MDAVREHRNVTVEEPSPAAHGRRRVVVDFLFLDRETCSRCAGTDAALESAIDRVAGLLDALAVDVVVRPIRVESAETARRTELEVSPTVRIDGRDVQPNAVTNPCVECSDRCADGSGIDCRLWTYRGETHATPPVELLVEALLRAAVGRPDAVAPRRSDGAFELAEDLEAFFGRSGDDRPDCGC
ncbi:DUF2703 domain-containing protein [Natronococcus wangiae]|uniref:DUF2703 domain-containing protein n=1 Tax=Natronococcus wangiae TaxID=3068275 RepID=UPI00273E5382|nr:DUF2703 domain-containing protein [Natronococcus sp. AD5]